MGSIILLYRCTAYLMFNLTIHNYIYIDYQSTQVADRKALHQILTI